MERIEAAQFEPGASVVKQQFVDDAASCQFFGGAGHGREIGLMATLDHGSMQLFESPGMPFSATHQADHCGGDAGFARHAELYASGWRKRKSLSKTSTSSFDTAVYLEGRANSLRMRSCAAAFPVHL